MFLLVDLRVIGEEKVALYSQLSPISKALSKAGLCCRPSSFPKTCKRQFQNNDKYALIKPLMMNHL